MTTHPTGIGVYARTLSTATHGTPEQMAKRLQDHGVSWVAFLACWQDKSGPGKSFAQRVPRRDVVRRYIDACARAGIDVWLWGFPWVGREELYIEAMRSYSGAPVRGWLHDPEVSYRDRDKRPPPGSRGQGEAVDAESDATASYAARRAQLLIELDAAARAELRLAPSGITSYGMAQWHALPWSQLAAGGAWGSPQLYTVSPDQVDAGLHAWSDRGFATLLPSIPTYGPKSGAALDAHLAAFVDDGDEPTIDGFAVWSYQQTGASEWRTLARWAEMLRAKACIV